jgi:hypothetical protein
LRANYQQLIPEFLYLHRFYFLVKTLNKLAWIWWMMQQKNIYNVCVQGAKQVVAKLGAKVWALFADGESQSCTSIISAA